MMRSVNCQKIRLCVNNSQKFGKGYDTTPAIATHTAWLTVCIVINHFKIETGLVLQKHDPIATYAKPAVANARNKRCIMVIYSIFAVINHDKIIACALVFIKT